MKGFLKQILSQNMFASFCNKFNPFVLNLLFFYPEKSENLKVFWCFQGVGKWCIVKKWVNFVPLMTYYTKAIIWGILFITNDFKQKDFTLQDIWRTSIHLFRVCWNNHLVSYFSLIYRYEISSNILSLTFFRAEF